MSFPAVSSSIEVVIEVGGMPIAVHTTDAAFVQVLEQRYGDYIKPEGKPEYIFDIELTPPETFDADADAEVWLEGEEWHITRGDFKASWNPQLRTGKVFQSANPYSFDAVLRIVHTLVLAPQGGFLLHASSAVRNGKAFLFSGVSEAGKTTMARLAPPDVALLTDEASYIRKAGGRYFAYGTPFAGELGVAGDDISAPVEALYLLAKGKENRIEPIEPAEALRRLLRNILFFAHDEALVRQVFEGAFGFVAAVPVYQLTFFPDQRVWNLIG